MNISEFQLRGVADPRLAPYATSALPAWLFSIDGSRVLWANPQGARAFGAANAVALAARTFGPLDVHRRQVAQLARRLPASGMSRLERVRGFGASLGALATCGCARLDFPDGSEAVLITSTETSARTMPLLERLRRLVEGTDIPIAAFARDGMFVGASDAARTMLGFRDLAEAGLEKARDDALSEGRTETPIGIGHMILQRVGAGADIGLVAFIAPRAVRQSPITAPDVTSIQSTEQAVAPAAESPASDDEPPAQPGEAPAGFAVVDEFAQLPDAQPQVPPHPVAEIPLDTAMTAMQATEDQTPAARSKPTEADASGQASSCCDDAAIEPRRHPLRFTWRMDPDGRFSLGSDEFIGLIGPVTAAGFSRPWDELAERFGFDPAGRIASAMATRHTWSAITLRWPVDGSEGLPVELSGLPVYDGGRNFAGYRGFGVCRDLDALTRLAALRRTESLRETEPLMAATDVDRAQSRHIVAAVPPAEHDDAVTAQPTDDSGTPVEPPGNVVPFRPASEPRSASLTQVENNAFDEIARQLSARLDNESEEADAPFASEATEAADPPSADQPAAQQPRSQPDWLAPPEPPARGESRRDRALLDLLPSGILIYRLDTLLYANSAFLKTIGYASLHALEQAGGLDALYVEAGTSSASSTSEAGAPVKITATEGAAADQESTDARLFTIDWDDDPALALIMSPTQPTAPAPAIAEPVAESTPSAVGQANAEELGAILDTTAEGIVMFDSGGNVHACNRSAEALFGYDGADLVERNLIELFAPESTRAVVDYLEDVKGAGVESLLDQGREVLGCVSQGGIIPLSMTMGRTRPDGPNFFAVFRDLSQSRKGESDLQQARRLTERAATAKADMLARISHEIRMPLNAIIGFAEVMIAERFGALGNERYLEYLKDIRASGERVTGLINDLLELSRIETGKLNLAFSNQNLNELVESSVTALQPQANRERIIIRTSLAHALPPVVADARALRQIALNLIGNSMQLANPGGQVIVSTALSDFGEVVLRVRDTGQGMNDDEVAAALEPFRTAPPSDQTSEGSAVSLSLTKALVEANRAQFKIRSAPQSGTLIEVVFPHAMARA
jgi:PAS domain S-box-containing protein